MATFTMLRLFIFLLSYLFIFFYPTAVYAERIEGHFNRLPLMRDEALRDGSSRAIEDIDYVYETPKGEYFEVDNSNPPIEAVVYKVDRIRQCKPLRQKRDEDLLIYYFHRVDEYASKYYEIVDSMVWGWAEPSQAEAHFKKLAVGYPKFSATYRAMGVASLASGVLYTAVGSAEHAVQLNRDDPKGLWLLSISHYALGNKHDSLKHYKYYKEAIESYPRATMGFWEEDYVKNIKPDIYCGWSRDIVKQWK